MKKFFFFGIYIGDMAFLFVFTMKTINVATTFIISVSSHFICLVFAISDISAALQLLFSLTNFYLDYKRIRPLINEHIKRNKKAKYKDFNEKVVD